MNAKNHKRFNAEFKQSAVQLALDMENTKKAAESLGISSKTLNTWVVKARRENYRPSLSSRSIGEVEKENAELRKKNRELEQVNLILKKAAAFFSQDLIK